MIERGHGNMAGHHVTDPYEKPLTARELEAIECLAAGLTNKQMGARMFLSEETVKTHVRNVLAKLGAYNRTHSVSLAYQRGLLNLSGKVAVVRVVKLAPAPAPPDEPEEHRFAGYLSS